MKTVSNYPVAAVGGEAYWFITDLLERIVSGEPIGGEDDQWQASMLLKYTLVDGQCHDGKHFESFMAELGYKKDGGAI